MEIHYIPCSLHPVQAQSNTLSPAQNRVSPAPSTSPAPQSVPQVSETVDESPRDKRPNLKVVIPDRDGGAQVSGVTLY